MDVFLSRYASRCEARGSGCANRGGSAKFASIGVTFCSLPSSCLPKVLTGVKPNIMLLYGVEDSDIRCERLAVRHVFRCGSAGI